VKILPVEKQLKPEQAVAEAEKALAGLVPAVPKPVVELTPKEEKVAAEIQKAETASAELSTYAEDLEKQLPMDVEHEAERMLADLEKSKLKEKEVMGEQRYRDEVEDIEETIKAAQEAEKAGNHEDAMNLIKASQAKMSLLSEIISMQRELAVAGAPSKLIDGVEKAYEFYSKGEAERANILMSSAAIYMKYPEIYRANPGLSDSFVAFVSDITSSKEIDVEKVQNDFQKIYDETKSTANRQSLEAAVKGDAMIQELTYIYENSTGELKKQTGEVLKRLKDIRERLSNEETMGSVSSEEIENVHSAAVIATEAFKKIEQIEKKKTQKALGTIYGNAVGSTLDGKNKEAGLHVFMAQEYLFSSDEKYRAGIVSTSSELAEGKTTYEKVYKQFYLTLVNEAGKSADTELIKFASDFKPAKELKPEEMDLDSLIVLRGALSLSKSVSEELAIIGDEHRETGNMFLANGYAALGKGDVDSAAYQIELFRSYAVASTDEERAGIANISNIVKKDPARGIELASQFFSIQDKSNLLKAEQLDAGGKEKEIVTRSLLWMEDMKAKVMAGEMLTEEEGAIAYRTDEITTAMMESAVELKNNKTAKDNALELFDHALTLTQDGKHTEAAYFARGASLMGSLSKSEQENLVESMTSDGATAETVGLIVSIYTAKVETLESLDKKISYYEKKNKPEMVASVKKTRKAAANNFDLAIKLFNSKDYTSAAYVADAASMYAELKFLPSKARGTDEAKAALAAVNMTIKAGKQALEEGKSIVDVLGKTPDQMNSDMANARLDIEAATFASDYNSTTSIAKKAKYKNQGADYEYVMGMADAAVKMYSQGRENIDKALKFAAEGNMEEAAKYSNLGNAQIAYSQKLMLAVKQYNSSVMYINTKNKTSGRAELLGAMKIYYALGNGYMIQPNGDVLADEKGVPVPLDEKTVLAYEQQAQGLLDQGNAAVEKQKGIKKTKKKLLKFYNEKEKELALRMRDVHKSQPVLGTVLQPGQQDNIDNANSDLLVSIANLKKAKKQIEQENFGAASKSLDVAGGLIICAESWMNANKKQDELIDKQKKLYAAKGDEAKGIVSPFSAYLPEVPEAVADFSPPGITEYDFDHFSTDISMASVYYKQGKSKQGNVKITDADIKMQKDEAAQQYATNAGANKKAAGYLAWASEHAGEMEEKPAYLYVESDKEKDEREEMNKTIFKESGIAEQAAMAFSGLADSYNTAAGLWEMASTGAVDAQTAIDFETEALAQTVKSGATAIQMAGMEINGAVELHQTAQNASTISKAVATFKGVGVMELEATAQERIGFAKTMFNNWQDIDGFMEEHGAGYAKKVKDVREREYTALSAFCLDKEKLKASAEELGEADAIVSMANFGYSVNWEEGTIEKHTFDPENEEDKKQFALIQESYAKFQSMRSVLIGVSVGPGGVWSQLFSEKAQGNLLGITTDAALNYAAAGEAAINGDMGKSKTKMAKGDDIALKKKTHGLSAGDILWAVGKIYGRGALTSLIPVVGVGIGAYYGIKDIKKLKEEAKAKEMTDIEYYQGKFMDWESRARIARMGTMTVGTGALFAASVPTAGTSALLATGIMAAEATSGLTETYQMSGGWKYMNSWEKGLFCFDIGMAVAMFAVPVGGLVVEEMAMGSMALQAATKLPKNVQMAQKAMEVAGTGILVLGTARAIVDAPMIYQGMQAGEISGLEVAFMLANQILPGIQVGLYARRAGKPPSMQYRSKAAQYIEALTLGTPVDDPVMHFMSKEAYQSSKLISKAKPADIAYFEAYKANREKNGSPVDIIEETVIITEFTGMKDTFTDFTMQDYFEFTKWKTQSENILKEPAAAMNDFVVKTKLDAPEQQIWGEFMSSVEEGGIPLNEDAKTSILSGYLYEKQAAQAKGTELNMPEYLIKTGLMNEDMSTNLKTMKTVAQDPGSVIKKEANVMPIAVGSEYSVVAPKESAVVTSAEDAAYMAPPKQEGAQEVGTAVKKLSLKEIEQKATAQVMAKIELGEVLKPGDIIHIAGTEESVILKKTVMMDGVENWVIEFAKSSDAKELNMVVIAVDKSGLNNEHVKGSTYIDATGNEVKITKDSPADVLSRKVLDDMLVEMKTYLNDQGYDVAIAKMGEGNCDERMFVVIGEKVPTPEIMEAAKEHARSVVGKKIEGGGYLVSVEDTTMTLNEWAEKNYPMDKNPIERMTAFSMDFSEAQVIPKKKGKVNIVESGYNEAVKAEMPHIEATMDAMGIGNKEGQLKPSADFDPQSQNYMQATFEDGYVVQTIIKPSKGKKAEMEAKLNTMIKNQDLTKLPERLRADYRLFQAKIGLGQTITFEEFVNIGTRKGYSFWEMVSFSEGNTILGYEGMNALGNKASEGVNKALGISPSDEVYLGNLMWYQKGKAKPDADAIKKAVNFEGAAFEVDVQVIPVKKGQTLADAEAKIFQNTVAHDLDVEVNAATLKNLEFLVRVKDPAVQEKIFDVPVTDPAFIEIAEKLGYTPEQATIALKYIASEIGTNRSIRRARDIINYLKNAGRFEDAKLLVEYAKYNGNKARKAYQALLKPPAKAPVVPPAPVLTPEGEAVIAFAKENPPKVKNYTDEISGKSYVTKVEGASAIAAIGDVHGDAGRLLYFLTQDNPETGVPILKAKPGKEVNIIEVTLKDGSKRNIIEIPENMSKEQMHTWLSENFDIVQHDGMQTVFTGDYIDRGGQPLEVMDVVMWMQDNAGENMIVHSLSGNHEKLFQRFLSEYGGKTTAEVEQILDIEFIGYGRIGVKKTYEAIKKRYANDPRFLEATGKGADAWQTMVKLLKEDGYTGWMDNLKGAVIIDNNLFTHGGPILGATTPEELNAYFAKTFEFPENYWSVTGDLGSNDATIMQNAKDAGDFSAAYASQWLDLMDPTNPAATPGLKEKFDAWKASLGVDSVYVGHEANETFAFSPDMGVTVIDGAMSRWYGGGESGIVFIDPANKTPAAWLAEMPEGMKLLDIGFGKKRNQVLKNKIAEKAEKIFSKGVKKKPPPVSKAAKKKKWKKKPPPPKAPKKKAPLKKAEEKKVKVAAPADYVKPYFEDPTITQGIKATPETHEALMKKGAKEQIMAQGVGMAEAGSFNTLINIMLQGEISGGMYGTLTDTTHGALPSDAAGSHGPYYIIIDDSRKGKIKTTYTEEGGHLTESNIIPEELHLAYVVDTEAHRTEIANALYGAVETGIITKDRAIELLSKVVTKEEVLNAPKDIFSYKRKTGKKHVLTAAERNEAETNFKKFVDEKKKDAEKQYDAVSLEWKKKGSSAVPTIWEEFSEEETVEKLVESWKDPSEVGDEFGLAMNKLADKDAEFVARVREKAVEEIEQKYGKKRADSFEWLFNIMYEKTAKKPAPPKLEAVPKAVEKPPVTEEQAVKILKGNKKLLSKKKVAELADTFLDLESAEDRRALIEYCKNTKELDGAFGVLKDINTLIENKQIIEDVYGDFHFFLDTYMDTVKESPGLLFPEVEARWELLNLMMTDMPAKFRTHDSLKTILFDLIPKSKKLGGKLDGVGKLDGATGAYEITIHVLDEASGELMYDADANPVTKKIYLKIEDGTPEKQGVKNMGESGAITPEVIADGEYLTFMMKEKKHLKEPSEFYRVEKKYFITEDVAAIKNGEVSIAGKDIQFDVDAGSSWTAVLTNSVLGDYVRNNLNEVKKLFGEHWAAALATGTLDRTAKNVWFFKIELTGDAKTVMANAEHLRKNGYTVIEENGKYYTYRFGSIDLDASGVYAMKLSMTGEPELAIGKSGHYNSVHGTAGILFKMFGIEGKIIPKKADIQAFFAKDSPFMEGVNKWLNNHADNAKYKKAIIEQYKSYEGDVGIGSPFGIIDAAALNKGIPLEGGKFSGEEGSYFLNIDNSRYKFLAEADRIVTDNPIEGISGIKQDTEYYMTPLKPGEEAGKTVSIDGKEFNVQKVSDVEAAPEGAAVVKRIGDNIIILEGTEKLGMETMKTGAIACFEAMLNLSPEGWAKILEKTSDSVIKEIGDNVGGLP